VTDGLLGRDTLLDTGPIVALLDRHEVHHRTVADAWPDCERRVVTTEAVLVEAAHLAARRGGNHALALEFLISAQVPVIALHLPMHEQCVHLLRRYADVPMDYADATLVALADRLRITRVFTLDRRGFRSYRGARGVPFELLPTP